MFDTTDGASMRDERDQAPETAQGDPEVARSPLRAHPASALWCTQGPSSAALPALSLICELRVDLIVPTDPDVIINSRLHAAETPLAACEIQTNGPAVVQTCTNARKMLQDCKILQNTANKPDRRIGFQTSRHTPYVVLKLADRICDAPPRTFKTGLCSRRPKVQ
jgi:hypothetical protein